MLALLLLTMAVKGHTLSLVLKPAPSTIGVSVEVGNDDYYRASSFYVDGGRRNAVTLRDLPSGELQVWVSEMNEKGVITHTDKRTFYVR